MRKRHRARHYARAFLRVFDIAEETLFRSLDKLSSYYNKNRLIFRLLQFSSARRENKTKSMSALCVKLSLPEPIDRLLGTLVRYKAIELLPNVLSALRSEFKKQAEIHDFTITSSAPLPPEKQGAIEESLRAAVGGTVNITYQEDSSLIAGIRIESKTYYWEDSIAGRIKDIRHALYTQEKL